MNSWSAFPTTTGKGHGFSADGRISPYFDGVEQAGGQSYRSHGPTYVPWSYPHSAEEQYRALTERVTLWDTACERQLQIRGKDALTFADRLVTRDLSKLQPGRCTYTFVCDEDGTVICDPVLLILDEETVWLSQSRTDLALWAKAIALQPRGPADDLPVRAAEQDFVSLATVDRSVAEPGTEVTVLWGEEPNSAKPAVERHRQVAIRATVAPAPYVREIRDAYRKS